MLKESLLIVSIGNDIHEDVVLFPETIDLVVLDLLCRPASMEGNTIVYILLLCNIVFVCVCECDSKIV